MVILFVWLQTFGDDELVALYAQAMKDSFSIEQPKDTAVCGVFMRIITAIKQQKNKRHLDRWTIELKLN